MAGGHWPHPDPGRRGRTPRQSRHRVVDAAERIDGTRDPFDRLIVAQAMTPGAALVTADHMIRDRFPDAVLASADHP